MSFPYIVFDRDGTLIELVPYLSKFTEVKFKRDVFKSLHILGKRGYRFGIVSNQSVIGRKIATKETIDNINEKIVEMIWKYSNVKVDFVRICPHLPEDNCMCRKPNPGLLTEAITKFDIDCERSYMVGDSESDIDFGKHFGLTTILIKETKINFSTGANFVVSHFSQITEFIE